MTTLYCLWWDNGESYDDHYDDLVGIYSTRELAEAAKAIDKESGRREGDIHGSYSIVERKLDEAR